MSTTETERPQAAYALGRTPEEYDRLRMQARVWEIATGRLLDRVGLARGTTCLDAGCGPGETMRLMAGRTGPAGSVLGIDADSSLGAMALATLHAAGHLQCSFEAHDLTAGEPIPGAPMCWRGCGTPSPPAAIWSCRTTTSAGSACSRRSPASTNWPG